MKNYLKFILHEFLIPYYWIFNVIVSLFLLWLSPMILIFWLIFFTICLKYFKRLTWKSFIRTWLPIFTLWYLILLVDLGKYSPIIIGPGYTEILLEKALYDGIYFERISLSTILTLHLFSSLLGFPIIIPVFNIFKLISRTDCQGGDESKSSKSTQSKGWFGGDGKTKNQQDAERCVKMADQMAESMVRNPYYQHKKMESKDGKRLTHNVGAKVPLFGWIGLCISHDKNEYTKRWFGDNKKP